MKDLYVEYEIYGDRRKGLRERLVTGEGVGRVVVPAVNGVSFQVNEGDAVAVLGSNGSGKSTLLSALAGVIPPTSGDIYARELPKLLGVGATLLPNVSGRRNITVGCLALGMTREEVADHVVDIIDFADIGDAIDRPLRTYSSGMRARLHFAIATAVQPRILLIDEALAVGDRHFKLKCRTRIEKLLSAAGTLMLVSHSTADIRELCTSALWMEGGKLVGHGPVNDVLADYEKNS